MITLCNHKKQISWQVYSSFCIWWWIWESYKWKIQFGMDSGSRLAKWVWSAICICTLEFLISELEKGPRGGLNYTVRYRYRLSEIQIQVSWSNPMGLNSFFGMMLAHFLNNLLFAHSQISICKSILNGNHRYESHAPKIIQPIWFSLNQCSYRCCLKTRINKLCKILKMHRR